jgi:hypothetical protein
MENSDFLRSHPIVFLKDLRTAFGSNLILGFSRYRYSPRIRKDDRVRFNVSIEEVTLGWLKRQLECLEPVQELALESRVLLDGNARHIPMLDFRGMTKGQLTAIMEIFPSSYAKGVHVYRSGRSYHAYFPQLLSTRRWIKFMGSALLCNSPSGASVVDQRWIGHRLIGGYAALRWSFNTPHYKGYPTRIDPAELDQTFAEKRVGQASAWIEGVPDKGKYFDGIVDWALRDMGVNYKRNLVRATTDFPFEFVIELADSRKVCVEAIYSDKGYLVTQRIRRLLKAMTSAKEQWQVSHVILITNSAVSDSDKAYLANANLPISIIEEVISPDGVLSRLLEVFRKIK